MIRQNLGIKNLTNLAEKNKYFLLILNSHNIFII